MAIKFASSFEKVSPGIPFLLSDKDLRGGFRVVADHAERDAIHIASKVDGMIVFSQAEAAFTVWNATAIAFEAWDVSALVTVGSGLAKNETSGALEVDTAVTDALYTAIGHGHDVADVTGLQAALDGKTATGHGHAVADITGLQDALDAAAPATHNHALDGLSNVNITDIAGGELLKWNAIAGEWANATLSEIGIAPSVHAHDWSAIQNVPQVSSMPGVTVSSVDPGSSDGVDGDIWFVVPA